MSKAEDDLATWLLEQVAEDERIAREADAAAHWAVYLEGYAIESDAGDWFIEPKILARHLARHDPARVLVECEAKRKLIGDLLAQEHFLDDREWYGCKALTEDAATATTVPSGRPCTCGRDEDVGRRLRLLALPYADRPGYREEWAI